MNIRKLYSDWIYQNVNQFKMDNESYQVMLPFINLDKEYIALEVRRLDDDKFYVNDYGYTLIKLDFDEDIVNKIVEENELELIKIDKYNYVLSFTCDIKSLIPKINILAQSIIMIESIFIDRLRIIENE